MSKKALASWTTLKKVTSQERAGLCLIFFLIDPQGPRVSCTAEYDVANPPNPKLKLDFVQHAETILSSRCAFSNMTLMHRSHYFDSACSHQMSNPTIPICYRESLYVEEHIDDKNGELLRRSSWGLHLTL